MKILGQQQSVPTVPKITGRSKSGEYNRWYILGYTGEGWSNIWQRRTLNDVMNVALLNDSTTTKVLFVTKVAV